MFSLIRASSQNNTFIDNLSLYDYNLNKLIIIKAKALKLWRGKICVIRNNVLFVCHGDEIIVKMQMILKLLYFNSENPEPHSWL